MKAPVASAENVRTEARHETLRIAGERLFREHVIEVTYPYTGERGPRARHRRGP